MTTCRAVRWQASIGEALTSLPEFGEQEIDRLQAEIAAQIGRGPNKSRKLDAAGVVNLYQIYRRVAVGEQ